MGSAVSGASTAAGSSDGSGELEPIQGDRMAMEIGILEWEMGGYEAEAQCA